MRPEEVKRGEPATKAWRLYKYRTGRSRNRFPIWKRCSYVSFNSEPSPTSRTLLGGLPIYFKGLFPDVCSRWFLFGSAVSESNLIRELRRANTNADATDALKIRSSVANVRGCKGNTDKSNNVSRAILFRLFRLSNILASFLFVFRRRRERSRFVIMDKRDSASVCVNRES